MNSMFRLILVVLVAAVVSLTGSMNARAADVSAGADVASAYVFRGQSVNDGWVLQPYLEVGNSAHELLAPLSLGVWANYDLDDDGGDGAESGQFSEIDLSASYVLPINLENASVSAGYTEYTYNTGDADRELNLIASYDNIRLSPEVAVYMGVDGALEDKLQLQLSGSHDESLSAAGDLVLNLGGTVAYQHNDSDDEGAEDGLGYVLLSAGVSRGIFSARADFWVETDEDVLTIEDESVIVVGISGAM